jgi:prolyl-tRNA synthetase
VSLRDAGQVAAAEEIYQACRAAGLDALLDDRDERPGVKFKDADLLGMPVRVTVGNALAKEGVVEVKERRIPRQERRVPKDQVIDTLCGLEVLRPRS